MPTLSGLYIYPIKSLGGIAVSEAIVHPKGFRHDRRFMLVEPARPGEPAPFITQRVNHHMALIDVAIDHYGQPGETLRVWHRHRPDDVLELPLEPDPNALTPLPVSIWNSLSVPALVVSDEADRWFTAALGRPCRLVFMPETTHRAVDPKYARRDDAVSFADGYPYLLIGQASLDDLNQRLPEPIDMLRFRPNLVVSGSLPYDEDAWQQFRIGDLDFYGVKPCARCVLTTIDPATGGRGKEPLRTLTTYRRWNQKILFGQNVLADVDTADRVTTNGAPARGGVLRVGQTVAVVSRQEPWLAPSTVIPALTS